MAQLDIGPVAQGNQVIASCITFQFFVPTLVNYLFRQIQLRNRPTQQYGKVTVVAKFASRFYCFCPWGARKRRQR